MLTAEKPPVKNSDVPCGSCTECCRGPDRRLALHPFDNPAEYETYEIDEVVYLARKDNDDCLYLTDAGCSIYERRPIVCRQWDCRNYVDHPNLPQRIRIEALKRA